ncbi:fimbrial chaperone [Salmonella enterica]|nr:fimbrial chaperone [Salmonella enterica]
MNKKKFMLKTLLLSMLMTSLANPAQAAFTLNGTRFIYEEGKNNISFEVTNHSESTYGGQVWIDNISEEASNVFFVPSPPFFKVNAGNKHIIRLMNVNDALPKDKESLFMLNVQEVPPKPKAEEGNVLAIAMNTRVKVIYRPESISAGRKDAEKQLVLVNRDGSTWVKNTTPYYFAITNVKINGKLLNLKDDVRQSLAQLAPFSEVNTRTTLNSGKISVEALNDWGGAVDYEVK